MHLSMVGFKLIHNDKRGRRSMDFFCTCKIYCSEPLFQFGEQQYSISIGFGLRWDIDTSPRDNFYQYFPFKTTYAGLSGSWRYLSIPSVNMHIDWKVDISSFWLNSRYMLHCEDSGENADKIISSFQSGCDVTDIIYNAWNLSVTTTSIIKFITCDLFCNVF